MAIEMTEPPDDDKNRDNRPKREKMPPAPKRPDDEPNPSSVTVIGSCLVL